MDRWRRRKMVYRGKMMFYDKNYGRVPSLILRFMLGILSAIKLLIWGIIYIVPKKRKRASLELESNTDVLKLCLHLS